MIRPVSNQDCIHVDLGGTSHHPDEKITGIPRVTLSLARELSQMGSYRGSELNLVSLLHDDQKVPNEILEKFDLARSKNDFGASNGTLVLLDSYYFKYNFLNKLPPEIREKYQVVDYVHDILPLINEGMFDISTFKFKHLIQQAFRFADAIMTPSRKSTDDIIDYILSDSEIEIGKSLKLGYSYHGADFGSKPIVPTDAPEHSHIAAPYFLMVGTIEVRKNHLFVLNAFEQLWENGVDIALCMAGRLGWKIESLLEKLENHPERDKRLFLINGPSDTELADLYKQSQCLIFASTDEGFGLPIIEAAHYGVPLLLSDISIFHEIAGEHARYFSLDDKQHLVNAVLQFIMDDNDGARTEDSSSITYISWQESAKNMIDIILDDAWYCEIHSDKSVKFSAGS